MDSVLPVPAAATLHRIRRVQAITIVWMSAEGVLSLAAAWMARSPALLAFGGDSAIELISAVVVYWRVCSQWHATPGQFAARITRGLLLLLAAPPALTLPFRLP